MKGEVGEQGGEQLLELPWRYTKNLLYASDPCGDSCLIIELLSTSPKAHFQSESATEVC